MKKLLVLLLVLFTTMSMTGCKKVATFVKSEGVMTYEEYVAAEVGSTVTVETFIQNFESWWDGKITLYTQDNVGAYFIYELPCTEEEAKKLTVGTKIKVTGTKSEWSGEVEITDATFEILEGSYTAEATDVTELCGKDELVDKMNMFAAIKGAKVVASTNAAGEEVAFLYSWNGAGEAGKADVYFNVEVNGTILTFNVRRYVNGCGAESEVYKAAEALQVGDTVNLEGFLYWYAGTCQARITKITK